MFISYKKAKLFFKNSLITKLQVDSSKVPADSGNSGNSGRSSNRGIHLTDYVKDTGT